MRNGPLAADVRLADTGAVSGKLRLAVLAALSLGVSTPEIAAACSPVPPPEPPPRAEGESAEEFAARRQRWFVDLFEASRKADLPGQKAREDHLWATAGRVVLARLEKIGSTRLRDSDGEYWKSPLMTLRPIKWLKGNPSPRRLKVHYLSADSCDFGGVGDVSDGEVGDVFLLFYRPGPVDPRNVLDSYDRNTAVTARTQEALALAASAPRKR